MTRIDRRELDASAAGALASGESAAAFSRRHGIKPQKLSYWKRVLGGSAPVIRRRAGRRAVGFVPVRVVGLGRDGERLVLCERVAGAAERRAPGVARAMLTLQPSVRIYLAPGGGGTDLRRSMDGLMALTRDRLGLDPLTGHLFLFRNRRGDRSRSWSGTAPVSGASVVFGRALHRFLDRDAA